MKQCERCGEPEKLLFTSWYCDCKPEDPEIGPSPGYLSVKVWGNGLLNGTTPFSLRVSKCKVDGMQKVCISGVFIEKPITYPTIPFDTIIDPLPGERLHIKVLEE